jgi:hypothetical protein
MDGGGVGNPRPQTPKSLRENQCNVPKPRCKEHHGFWCLLNFYWLWHSVKHFVDLLVYMYLLAGWPLDFGLRV